MTYKKIVEGMIIKDSVEWVERLLDKHGIKYVYVLSTKKNGGVAFQRYDTPRIYYDCNLSVHIKGDILPTYIVVGGTVDEYGVNHSCISRDCDYKNIIWMDTEERRVEFGITEFKIGECV